MAVGRILISSINQSITKKITLLVSVLVIASSIAVGLPFYLASRDVLINEKFEALTRYSTSAINHIEATLADSQEVIAFLKNTPPVQGIIRAQQAGGLDPLGRSDKEQWRKRLEVIFTELMRSKLSYVQLRYIGIENDGMEIVRVDRKGSEVMIIPPSALQKKGSKKYFQETIALQEGELYLSDVELNRDYGKLTLPYLPVLRLATPIYDAQGDIFGIIIANLSIQPILRYIRNNESKMGTGHNYYATNSDGDYIDHPEELMTYGFEKGVRYRLQDEHASLKDFYAPNNQQEEITLVDKSLFVPEVINLKKLYFDPRNNERYIVIGSEYTYEAILDSAAKAVNKTILVALPILLLFILATFIFSNLLARPLRKITAAVDGFASGRHSDINDLPLTRSDEIGFLAKSFSSMMAGVEERERALKNGQIRLDAIFNSVNESVITIDSHGIIEMANGACRKLFGYTEKELIGNNVSCLMPDAYKSEHDGYINKYITTGEAGVLGVGRELAAQKKDGTIFPIDLSISEFHLEGARYFSGVIRDISQRKDAEQKLLEALASAEQANMAKTEFLSVMNHELRTPLNGVLGMLSLLNDSTVDDEQRVFINTAIDSAQLLLSQLNDIIEYTNLESMFRESDDVVIDLEQVFEGLLELYADKARTRGITLSVEGFAGDTQPQMTGDIKSLTKVLRYLIDNAIKYTEHGNVVLSARYTKNIDNTCLVTVEVKDSGIGISSEIQNMIFEPFYQGDSSSTRAYGGTGLGLSVAKRIVEYMNGNIGVESTPGQGSRFWFTIRFKMV